MSSSRITRARVAAVAAGVAAVVVAGTSVANAADPTSGSVTVPQGTGPAAFAGATPTSTTDPNTPMQVSFVLRARNTADLESKVTAGWKGSYLTSAQFADQYGQTPAVVSSVESYLHHYGITTHAYGDRLDIATTGTAGQYEKALSVGLNNYTVKEPAANGSRATRTASVYGTKADPKLPASSGGQDVGASVLAILGLSNYSPFASQSAPAVGTSERSVTTDATGSLPKGELSPADFASRYDLTGLTSAGAQGQGRTIGIVTLASFDPSTPVAFWNKYLGLKESTKRITTVTVDGGAGAISSANGSDESDLDVEQSGALAPKANIRVYVAPNTDPGFADAFYDAATQNIADSVSVSWGESETYVHTAVAEGTETSAYEAAFDQAFLELGAQGQSAFASAGDQGAYDATADAMTTNLAVDTPADSPYITSAGGTTLPGTQTYALKNSKGKLTGVKDSADIPAERAWSSDYLWPMYGLFGATSEAGAVAVDASGGGGGYSVDEPRPSYQKSISGYQFTPYLTPTTPKEVAPGIVEPTGFQLTPVPPTGSGSTSTGRGEPDVSTNADPQTGYAVYDPTIFASSGGFAQYGGTSFVAPQLNGSTAVIDSAVGHRVGFWNPKAYAAARSGSSPFTTLNSTTIYSGVQYLYQTSAKGKVTALAGSFSNDNLHYTGNPGAYWTPATGLGTPNFVKLAKALG